MRLRIGSLLALAFILLILAQPVGASTSEYLNYTEDYVDNNTSDVDSTEYGTHSNFENEKLSDSTYDTLQEENTGGAGSDTEDFVDQLGTSHLATPDVGTHSDWTEMQDEDDTYNTMTEADTGGSGVDEDIYVDTAPSPVWTQTGTTPYIDEGLSDGNYISTSSNGLTSGWYNFAPTTASGSGCTVVIYVWVGQGDDDDCDWQVDWTGDGTADASGTWTDPTGAYYNTGTLSGCDTDTEINQMQIRFTFRKGGGAPTTMTIDEAYANVVQAGGSNYDLDLELGWTNAPYTETNIELCIDTGTLGAENLRVDIWDEVTTNDWVNLDTALTASYFNNYSISAYINSGTVEIRFTDTSDEATAQDTYQIDCVLIHGWSAGATNYELDLEVQFTSITATQYGSTVEYLCIETGTFTDAGSEHINVEYWNGADWTSLGDLAANTWNNITIHSYLDSATFTIHFLGSSEVSDTNQGTFEIDAVLIRTHSYAYTETQGDIIDIYENDYESVDYSRTYYDTIDIFDTHSLAVSFSIVLNDLIDLFDTYSTLTVQSLILFDSIGFFDTISLAASFVITLFELIGLADSLFVSKVVQLLLGEIIQVYDTIYFAASFSITLGEILPIFEIATTSASFSLVLNETLPLYATNFKTIEKNFTELIDVWDSVNSNRVIQLILYEQIDLYDTYSLAANFSITLNELLDIFDTYSTSATFSIILSDLIDIFDSISASKVVQLLLYEQIDLFDSICTGCTYQVFLSELIDIFDTYSTSSAFSIVLTDIIDIFDSISVQVFAEVTQLILYEVIDYSEAVYNSMGFSMILTELIEISEAMSKSFSLTLILNETIGLYDSVYNLFTGQWYLTFGEVIDLWHNDVWAPYRPIVTTPTTTTDPNEIPWNPGSTNYIIYYNLAPIAAVFLAIIGGYYVTSVKPKELKGKTEMKIKGVKTTAKRAGRTVERITSGMPIIGKKKKNTRKKTVKKRQKKGSVLVRKVKRKVPKKE